MALSNVLQIVFGLAVLTGAPVVAYAEEEAASPAGCDAGQATEKAKDPCYQEILEQCQAGGKAAGLLTCNGTSTAVNTDKTSMAGNLTGTGSSMTSGGEAYKAAAQKCEGMMSKCDKLCSQSVTKRPDSKQKCIESMTALQKQFDGSGTSFKTQGAELSSRGSSVSSDNPKDDKTNGTTTTGGDKTPTKDADKGSGMNMGSMLGMGAMAAVAGMAIKQKMDEDDAKDEANAASNSALQANGTVLCDKADSGLYVACNSYLETACTQAIQNSTFSSSPTCTNFATRYCTGGDGSVEAASATTTTLGTNAAAATMPTLGVPGGGHNTRFCSNAIAYNYCSGGGNPTCSKCQELANLTSLACTSNPAACMAQSSDAATAAGAANCPGYPTTIASTAPLAIPGTSIPAATTSPLTALTLPTTTTGAAPASLQSVSGASIIGRSTASSAGPASDIGGEYGPSLLNMTSQAVGVRCKVDHLNNCP